MELDNFWQSIKKDSKQKTDVFEHIGHVAHMGPMANMGHMANMFEYSSKLFSKLLNFVKVRQCSYIVNIMSLTNHVT